MGFDVEVVAELNSDLGEGPCWDHASQSLLFVDVTPGHIYRLDHATGALHRAEFGQEVGAAIPDSAGGLVVAARDGIYQADHSGNKVSLLAAVEADNPGNRMNDAKCDPSGRLWAGTMAFDFRQGAASLYRIEHTAVTTMLTDLTISNGTGWSPDGGLMYFIDSATFRIDVFDFDPGEKFQEFTDVALGDIAEGVGSNGGGNVHVAALFHNGLGVALALVGNDEGLELERFIFAGGTTGLRTDHFEITGRDGAGGHDHRRGRQLVARKGDLQRGGADGHVGELVDATVLGEGDLLRALHADFGVAHVFTGRGIKDPTGNTASGGLGDE